MGILFAVKKWGQYLLRREFIIKTDHKSLKYLLEQRLYTEAQHTWLFKLHNYKFVVEYKKEKKSTIADSLSRKEDDKGAIVFTITTMESDWLQKLKGMMDFDPFF